MEPWRFRLSPDRALEPQIERIEKDHRDGTTRLEELLKLRIIDPAMGSGHGNFHSILLVATARRVKAIGRDPSVKGARAFGPGMFVSEAFAVPVGVGVDTMAMADSV